jgi:Tripartite tricarboxylate transporter family receptor
MSIWAGIFAPRSTPKEIVDKLAGALDQALDDPGVKKRLTDLGGSIAVKADRTPARFSTFVQAEIAERPENSFRSAPRCVGCKRVIRIAGIQPLAARRAVYRFWLDGTAR